VRRELESLRSLKELNHRDIEEFKRQNEQLIHQKRELQMQVDAKQNDQSTL
jgi:hypothetical protein